MAPASILARNWSAAWLKLDFLQLPAGGFRPDQVADDRADPEPRCRKEWDSGTELADPPTDQERRRYRGNAAATYHDSKSSRSQVGAEKFAQIGITDTPQPSQHS